MHPQSSDKKLVCKSFFDALEKCHADSWLYWTGGCNQIKHDLNMCLRQERLDRAAKNREDAKTRRAKAQAAWADLHRDD
ncbi:hypothetical protein PUNSTDRAFT_121034 [Punctularia strigosozonata HHB-11173 SS5]|uniref:uncharacterized protein n=1 Tax=Punctularia strigosozonata (strain HHB-11173) TaxID=741275 RepID=UPI0004417588|nr:uncharacterized protein PUNSTDRAFT_121034 [Punctularia strigosozonata HHB-11173 SS5]EIN07792.1 hypothetical protein PUNSTDRAFT_121034 [Punctularia strigosozonata HHB-11173 SS5]